MFVGFSRRDNVWHSRADGTGKVFGKPVTETRFRPIYNAENYDDYTKAGRYHTFTIYLFFILFDSNYKNKTCICMDIKIHCVLDNYITTKC